ncbi:hypothetical protein Angca_001932, partial [Angiostrongylus cantonensis]
MTVLHVTLLGGPPWGLRLGSDEELRPIVSKMLKNGRAACAGVRIGDVLRSVNSRPVLTCKQTHTLMQKTQGKLKLGIVRSSASGSSAPTRFRGDVKSSYVGNLNILSSNPRNSREKSFRLDLEAVRGATKLKRRFFEEQIAKNSVTDRLLARKIQLGMLQNGAPSESTTGYDSVEADFAGGRSNATSSRTSPSLVAPDELDEITIVESPSEAPANSSTIPVQPQERSMPENDARSETVVPDRQSVADLRRQITSCLEMKTPETASRCSSRAENTASPLPSRNFYHSFIKVHEASDPKKPYLGRVLDGPIAPEKFYQGVLPPSYNQCHSPATCPTPDSKPPIAPTHKPQLKHHTKQNFLSRIAKEPSPAPEDPPRIAKHENSTSLVTHGKSLNASQDQHKYEQPSNSDQNTHPEAPEPSHTNTTPLVEKSFNTLFQTAITENIRSVEDKLKQQLMSTSSHEERPNQRIETRMPDLLKSRSPAPFSLSAASSNQQHRPEKQQKALGSDDLTRSLRDALALLGKSHQLDIPVASSVTNDSGYDGSTLPNSDTTVTGESTLSELKYEHPFGSAESFLQLAQESPKHPAQPSPSSIRRAVGVENSERKLEKEDCSVGAANDRDPASSLRDGIPNRFVAEPSNQCPEMSTWYRNMFKKMHKIETPAETSVLRHRLRESSPALTISRPITPLSFTAHTPTRYECELTPRRAKSVGRIVESNRFANANSANRYALEASRTTHYHLPSYRFVHEDPRLIVSKRRSLNTPQRMCGVRCLRCGLPRKDPTWKEIDATVNSIFPTENRSLEKNRQIQSRVVLRYINENLEDTANELSQFIQRLDEFWKRSKSSPQLLACGERESLSTTTADEIAELKRISKEELLYRQKAERLAEELQDQRNRRHGYIPSTSPSLLLNKDRFSGLLDEYSRPNSTSLHQIPVRTATAIFKFEAKSPRYN